MLFSSYIYVLLFLPISVLGFYFLGSLKNSGNKSYYWIVGCSLFFYGFWSPIYLVLILASLAFNFFLGKKIGSYKEKDGKMVMVFGVAVNLCLLGYFKYFNFFIDNVNSLFEVSIHVNKIVLPLAISFFTFQQVAYLVDAYEGKTKEYDPLHYCLFITFFPQLIAGPIVHHKELMPQFAEKGLHTFKPDGVTLGLSIFMAGLAKKVILADTFGIWVNEGYSNIEGLTFASSWLTSFSYTLQLYFDFSGYSEMAIGSALLFNIRLPLNFNSPYRCRNIRLFWRNWHMTLSVFLKDYLYIKLGGNRQGTLRTYVNTMVTMVLVGFWHGAGWQFVIFGIVHGIALMINQSFGKLGLKLPHLVAWFLTFNFVNLTFVIFRAKTIDDTLLFYSKMITFEGFEGFNGLWIAALVVGFLIAVFPWSIARFYTNNVGIKLSYKLAAGFSVLLFLCFLVMEIGRSSEFLYFQF